MADTPGISYMRTTRGAYPGLYADGDAFPVGGSKTLRSGPNDQVTLIGAGVTLHNCLAAADQLGRDGISARVVDLYSVKPIDTETLLASAAATGGRLVVAEDHYPAGGIGGAVLEAFNDAGHPVHVEHLAVRDLPGSGTPQELMEAAGISAGQIAQAAREVLRA
jgi:transketolase